MTLSEAIAKVLATVRSELADCQRREAALRQEDGGLVDQFLGHLLDEVTKRGIDMSDCDGDDPPEVILANWIASRTQHLCEKHREDPALNHAVPCLACLVDNERAEADRLRTVLEQCVEALVNELRVKPTADITNARKVVAAARAELEKKI